MVDKMVVGHATPLGANPFGKNINEVLLNQPCSECEPFAINNIAKCTKINCMYKQGKGVAVEGRKDDKEKPKYAQFFKHFARAYDALIEVATYGFIKYSEDIKNPNWKKVSVEQYEDALFRHFSNYLTGEEKDKESGKKHLAHIIWNACVLYELNEGKK